MGRRKLWEGLFLLLLFLFGLGFLGWTGYWYVALSLLGCLLWGRRLQWPQTGVLLAGFSALYFLTYAYWHPVGANHVIYYLWGPWTAFFLGWSYARERDIWPLVLLPTVGMCLHGLLNWYAYSRSDYSYATSRIAVDFWRGGLASVTYMGMLLTPAASICTGLVFWGRGRELLAAGLGLTACLAATVFFANRTLLLICGLLLLWQCLGWLGSKEVPVRRKALAVLLVCLCALGVWGLLLRQQVRDWLWSLKLTQRLLGREHAASRLSLWLAFFRDGAWLRHPFGGDRLITGQGSSWFHNLFLDMYRSVGLLPTGVLLAVLLRTAGSAASLRGGKKEKTLQCLLLGVLLNCMVEPVVDASPYYFLTVLLWLGAVEGRRARVCT